MALLLSTRWHFSFLPDGTSPFYKKYSLSASSMAGSLWILCPTRKASLCAYWQGAGTRIVPCKYKKHQLGT